MAAGFGEVPDYPLEAPDERQGRAAQGDVSALLQLMQRDIQKIRERWVKPKNLTPISVNLTANGIQRVVAQPAIVAGLIVQVYTNTLDVWFGDMGTVATAGMQPHLRFAPGEIHQVLLPVADNYTFTLFASGGACTASFIMVSE